MNHQRIAGAGESTIVLNDDNVVAEPQSIEWLLIAIFPDPAARAFVRSEMGARLTPNKTLAEIRTEIEAFAVELVSRERNALSTAILHCVAVHREATVRNSATYPSRLRNRPESGFWAIPNDPGNGRSLYEEFPYRHRRPLLDKTTPIVSAGSCFAVEIARYFQKNGFNYLITEPESGSDGSYAMQYADDGLASASAAWGVIFNTPSFRQLVEKAFGVRALPKVVFEGRAGIFYDPFREGVEFSSIAGFEANYDRHLAATREALTRARVLIITLGLNEVWTFKMDGSVFSRSPARIAPSLIERHVLSVEENVADLQAMLDILRRHNPDLELIVTLSPIGLHATFLQDSHHVVEANTHSKAVLRVAAEEFVSRNERVYYFPSYELVMTGISAPWEPDQRHVSESTVARVMQMFEEMYVK